MRNFKDIILEKLKISKKTLSDNELTVEATYYEFVIWYIGFNKKPDEITEWDFRRSDFIEFVVDSKGDKIFINSRVAYDFYKEHKNEIVTITIEKMKGQNNGFINIIDFGDDVFYADSLEDFREYIQYRREIEDK